MVQYISDDIEVSIAKQSVAGLNGTSVGDFMYEASIAAFTANVSTSLSTFRELYPLRSEVPANLDFLVNQLRQGLKDISGLSSSRWGRINILNMIATNPSDPTEEASAFVGKLIITDPNLESLVSKFSLKDNVTQNVAWTVGDLVEFRAVVLYGEGNFFNLTYRITIV